MFRRRGEAAPPKHENELRQMLQSGLGGSLLFKYQELDTQGYYSGKLNIHQ